jgi:hypothetical protein
MGSKVRAVASMYSWGGGGGGGGGVVGQKFPNDEKHFPEYFMACEATKVRVCYPKNEDAIYKQKYACFTHRRITEAWAENEGRRPEGILKFRVSEMPFPGLWGSFDRILMVRKQCFSLSKFTICLQFSSTKWAKVYLINYTYWRSCRKVWVI